MTLRRAMIIVKLIMFLMAQTVMRDKLTKTKKCKSKNWTSAWSLKLRSSKASSLLQKKLWRRSQRKKVSSKILSSTHLAIPCL